MKNFSLHDSPWEDNRLAMLVEEVTSEFLDGKQVDFDALRAEYPQYATQLKQIEPTLTVLADWGEGILPCHGAEARTSGSAARSLGDFRLVGEIGRGGMGIVYEAEQLSLGRPVAVKVLPFAALLDRRQLERFKNEARAAAMLKHPNIVSVHSVGVERGVHYYAMELIEGLSLAEVVVQLQPEPTAFATSSADAPEASNLSSSSKFESGRETEPIAQLSTLHQNQRKEFYRSVACLGIQAANALHYAHGEGVIHRDIKPSNLLLDQDGNLHITDFGLARIQMGDNLTMSGDVIGTLRYMSPEQLEGTSVVDERTDVYALGATLYELLCGVPSIAGSDRAELVRQIALGRPKTLRQHDARIPRDLETIVHKCLTQQAHQRYASAGEMAADLQRFCESRPILARRTPAWQVAWQWAQRNRRLAAMTVVALIALFTLAIAGPWMALQQGHLRMTQQALNSQLRDQQVQLQAQLYDSHMRDAATAVQRGNYDRAGKLLELYLPRGEQPNAENSADARAFEWFTLWRLVQLEQQDTVLQHWIDLVRVAVSSDGKYLACAGWDGAVIVFDRPTRTELHRFQQNPDGQAIVQALEFSPDSRYLFSGGEKHACLWDVTEGKPVKRWHEQAYISSATFSLSDGRWLAIGTRDEVVTWDDTDSPVSLVVYDTQALETGNEVPQPSHLLEGGVGRVNDLVFSPSGRQLLAASCDNRVRRWEVPSFKVLESLALDGPIIDRLAFHPKRKNLLAVSSARSVIAPDNFSVVTVVNVQNGQATSAICDSMSRTAGLAFSANGRLLATGHGDGRVRLWATDVLDDDLSTDVLKLDDHQAHSSTVEELVFSADGKTVYSVGAGGLLKERRITPANTKSSLIAHGSPGCLAFFRDGRRLISGRCGNSPALQIWDTDSGTLLKESPTGSTYIVDLKVLPSGQQVAYTGYAWKEGDEVEVGIWDVLNNQRQILFRGGQTVRQIALSPDGKHLAAGVGNRLLIFDIDSGAMVEQRKFGSSRTRVCVAWHPQSSLLAIGQGGEQSQQKINLWDFREKHTQSELTCNGYEVISITFSPDGQRLAASTRDGPILLWDDLERAGALTFRTLRGHSAHVWDIEFSPDGRRLATAGLDRSVRLWNVETGNELLYFYTPGGWNYAVAFTHDGTTLAYGGPTGPIEFVRAEPNSRSER